MNMNLDSEENTDINLVNDNLHPSVQHAVAKIAKKNGFVRHKICKRIISSEGGNYLGIIYAIDIKGETADGIQQNTSIIVKQKLKNSENVKIISMSDVYKREIFVYKELTNIFAQMQDEANIPINERFKMAKIYEESDDDAIIFENMATRGFKTYGRHEVMNLKFAELAVEQLAKFHGLGFIIERRMPEYYENKIKTLDSLIPIDAETNAFMRNVYESATKKFSPELKMKTDKWWETASENYIKYIQSEMTNVKGLCHGDFKMNNVMWKENEGEIAEVVAIDYQLADYGSPILDLVYFLFLGTDQKFRKNHLEHIKDHYFSSLKRLLEYFDVLVDEVYPREEFEKNFEDCLDFGLMICVWILPFVMIYQDEDLDIGNYEALSVALKFDDNYYERLQDIFDDFFK